MYPSQKFTPKPLRREKTTLSSNSDNSSKNPVSVFCRLRPLKSSSQTSCVKVLSPTTLSITTPTESKSIKKETHCIFKEIFSSYASQRDVFDRVAKPLLEDLLQGKNGLLFSYGVTGSGKTFTLTGEQSDPGIMPRCIDTLFNSIKDLLAPKFMIKPDHMNGFEVQSEADAMQDRLNDMKSGLKSRSATSRKAVEKISYTNDGITISSTNASSLYAVFLSYVEIYNNVVYDLLDESSGKTLQSKILREDLHKNMYVNGAVEVEVRSAEEAFEVFNAGQKRKRMEQTRLNADSSRSHSIFNLRVVELEQLAPSGDKKCSIPDFLKVSQLSLVDLAGSERTNRTQNKGLRLKEASSINNSLMTLRTCLEILRENQKNGGNKLVPYRDSRLTLLFRNYFEGDGKVEMIVCINPAIEDYEENMQVLKFAEMAQEVKIVNVEVKTPYRMPKTPITTPSAKVKSSNSHLPKIGDIILNEDDSASFAVDLERLLKQVQLRRNKVRLLKRGNSKKEKDFRKRLGEIYQENLVSKSEMSSLQTMVRRKEQKVKNLGNKLIDLETVNSGLVNKITDLENVITGLRRIVDEKDFKINQKILEKEKAKQKLALNKEKMTQELDAKLRRQREHLNAAMKAKDHKIQKAREILDAELRVDAEPEEVPYEPENTPPPPRSDLTQRRNVQRSAAKRRSRSAGEVWLEHNAVTPVPLGTILQPSMKKRKSITKLSKASDVTNPKQSKYCLIAQDQDADGEIETKVYKGDIVPTCGGGAQVIFNDVELLRQKSPTATP